MFVVCVVQSVGIDKGDIPDLAKVSIASSYYTLNNVSKSG